MGVSRGRRGCGGVRPRSAAWWQMRMRTRMRVRTHLHEAVGDDARQQPKGEGGQPRHLRIPRKGRRRGVRCVRNAEPRANASGDRSCKRAKAWRTHTPAHAQSGKPRRVWRVATAPQLTLARVLVPLYGMLLCARALSDSPQCAPRPTKESTRPQPATPQATTTAGPLLLFPSALSQENRKGAEGRDGSKRREGQHDGLGVNRTIPCDAVEVTVATLLYITSSRWYD